MLGIHVVALPLLLTLNRYLPTGSMQDRYHNKWKSERGIPEHAIETKNFQYLFKIVVPPFTANQFQYISVLLVWAEVVVSYFQEVWKWNIGLNWVKYDWWKQYFISLWNSICTIKNNYFFLGKKLNILCFQYLKLCFF